MIVDHRFNVTFESVHRVGAAWRVIVRLYPDPATVKRPEELHDRTFKRLTSVPVSGDGATPVAAFASALRAAADKFEEKA